MKKLVFAVSLAGALCAAGGMDDYPHSDADGDGLLDSTEYFLSNLVWEVDGSTQRMGDFDPLDAFSLNQHIGDEFALFGNYYVGGVFTDHDMMDDRWEAKHSESVSMYLYDANLDPDNDGWSNYAEFQAGTDPSDGSSYPVPRLDVSISYCGCQAIGSSMVIVKAWKDAGLETLADASWSVGGMPGRGKFRGIAAPNGDDPYAAGHVREGMNTFVAFADLDGNGEYTAGEPFGAAAGVDVGWYRARLSIGLSDTCGWAARIVCRDATADSEAIYGSASNSYAPDRIAGGNSTGGRLERVRIIRTHVDGVGVWKSSRNIPMKTVLDKMVHIDGDATITEADFLSRGDFDVDWDDLSTDIYAVYGGQVTSVTYRVIVGDCDVIAPSSSADDWNIPSGSLLGYSFTRKFSASRAVATPVGQGIVRDPCPTFTWTIPDSAGGDNYSAFKLKIYDESGSEIWDSGYRSMPAKEKNATYGWQYSWTAPISVGDRLVGGPVFPNATNYSWRVSVYNAKYRDDEFSARSAFRMNVLTNSMDYGTAKVAVKYFGPDLVRNSGVIRVQAFDAPDFAGVPVAAGYVADKSKVADEASVEANATIAGLKAGTYYIRAFVDSNGNGECDEWESWGFHCVRDTAGTTLYTPVSVKVGPEIGASQTIDVYIDDCDTDRDNLPDAWEFKQRGELTSFGVDRLDLHILDWSTKKSITFGSTATNFSATAISPATPEVVSDIAR